MLAEKQKANQDEGRGKSYWEVEGEKTDTGNPNLD